MPVIRVEIPTTRDDAKRVFALYRAGSKYRGGEEAAVEEAWRLGRTPTGAVHFAGLTNGQPPSLKYDVAVHTELATP